VTAFVERAVDLMSGKALAAGIEALKRNTGKTGG